MPIPKELRRFRPAERLAVLLVAGIFVVAGAADEIEDVAFRPEIPIVWDESALSELELPLAESEVSVEYASAEYYYSLPVRTIFRQYPVYAPG